MDEKTRTDISRRLASAAGHLKGIQRMVEEDTYCIDVIHQIDAVQAALHKVSTLMLDNHLHTCVTAAIRGDDPDEREQLLREVTSVFAMGGKR
ncbi:MAG: metal-sensitive transcriptional regulator [Anaerolineae bacterium]|nr:metal-sensitive transcriptional regulator [Anaerolineae bacterium]